jgi:hypothetical protein
LAFDVLEHVPHFERTVAAKVAALRTGGLLVEQSPFEEGDEAGVHEHNGTDTRLHTSRHGVTMAQAMGSGDVPGVNGRLRAQDWLRAKGYQPTPLNLGPLTRLGGRVTQANIAFDDHPTAKRFSNRIETVTVDSVFDWMQRAQLAQSAVVSLR